VVEAATVLGISPVTRAALEADEEEAAPAEDAVSLARTTRMPNVVRDSNWEERLQRTRGELARARGVSASTLHVKVARTLLDHSPEDGDIEPSLRRALEADGHNVEARNLLLGLLRSQERWEEVGAVLEQKASDTSSRREDVRAALIELAELQRGVFGDEAAAAATFEKVLALDPSHPDALAFARAYHEGKQDWAALVDLYENALRLKRRTPEEMDLLLELGELLWRKVGDMQAAERQFRRVRLADARSLEMLRFYEAFYKAEGDWKKYYATLSSLRQQIEDEREALALCYEMARVASQEMGAPEKAIDVWKSVLKIDPRDAQARQALHDLYIEAKKWNALLEHYKEEIALLEGEPSSEGAQVDLYLKIVEIYRDRLRLEVMVINTYNAILQLDPTHAEAIEALASRYEQGRRWNDLIGILQKKAEVLMGSAPSASLPVLHRIAELWQKSLGNAAQAIPTLEQILSLDARDKVAIDALKELYQQRRDWGALLQVLEKEAALLEGEGLAVHLAEMARIAHQRQSDPSSARALYERLCGALEGEVIASPRLYREALKELEGIYEDQRDEAALARVLERRLRVTEGDAQRIDTLERLASLAYGGLGSPERAVSLWGQILELDRDHEGALTRLTDHYVQERRWESLEALFGARGDWARLFEILDSGAAVVEDEGEQAALYRRMTRVAREELRDNDKLILSLESLQGLWPRDPEVARALLPCYRAAKEPAKEVQANQVLLETEGGDAFALTCEIARLYEESLGDKAQAFDWLDRAFRMRPGDEALRAQMEHLATSAGRLAELVATYRQVAEGVEEDEVRLALYRTVARTCHVDLDWLDDAVDYFERVLRVLPEDHESVDALLSLYRALERWEDLLGVMGRKIDLLARAGQGGEVVELRFQMAELLQGPLGRRAEAVACYQTIREAQPESLDAVRGLKALYQQGGDWAGVAEATEAELGLLEAQGALGEAEELRLQLGTLYEDQLQAPDAAVSWYASLLGAEGGSRAPAVSALEGILALSEGDASRQERVATLLEPVYRKDENWERLSAALEIRLSAMEAVEARRGTLWELAALYEGRAEDQGRAFGALRRLLGVSSQDPQVWDELERVAGQVGQWGEVASLYDALTPELGESAQPWRYQLLRRQARIEEQELGRDVNARRAYEILLDQDPADKMAMGSLDEVYARLGAWPELVELLGRKIALEEEAAGRRSLRLRICDIYEERLEDPASAIDTYRAVLSELPGDGEALDQLERLLGQQGRWPELVELLTGRAEAAQGEGARRDIRYQLGAVLQHQLGELPRAVEVYRGLLGQEPVHGDALGAMEGLSVALEGSHDLGLRAAVDEALEPIYAGREDWARLGRILGLKLSYAEEVEAQIGLRVRLARLERDRLQRPEVAFAHLREAVALRCEDQGLRAELEALAGQTGGHMQVIGLYEQLLDEAVGGDAALRRALLERIAATHEAELVDVHSAINAWRRMLELDPTDLAALGSLERLHEEQRQWPELVEVCLQRAELVVGEAQVSALRKVGALYRDRLQDLGAAVETYDRIRGLIPGDAGALDALESLYEAREDWPALVQTLREKIAHCGDDEVKRAHHLRVARLLEEELRDPVGAIEVYHEVLALVRADAASLDALDRLYQEHERWEELSAILGRKQALCEEEEGRWCELRYRQGQVQQHQLFQVEEALETYRSVLARRAGHEETRSALVALLGEGAHRDAASRVLEPIYRQEARHEALVGLLELQLEEREEAQERLRILDDLARLHEVELVRPAAAFHAVRRAYLIDPAARARVSAMERLADQTDEHGALVMAYEEALPGIKDDAEALRVQLKVAATYRDQLQDALAAEDAFRKALERSPGSLEALEALEALMTAQARWIDLLEVLERKHAALSGQGGAAQEVLFAIARLHDETLDDPSSAIQTWLRVLEGEETNAEAIHALKALYRREGRWHDLTALLLREIGYAPEVSAAVRLRTELAGVYHRELLDLRQTVEVYRRILGDVPDHAETVASLEALFAQEEEVQRVAETLEPIYRRREDWGRLVPVLEVRLQAQEGAKARRGLMLQIARIQEEKLGALVEAMGAWRRVLEDDPREEAVWAQMERLAAAQGAWEALAEAYGEALLSGGRLDDGARRALLMRHAQVLDERLDRIEEAREVYREVLAFDEGDAVANDALDRILTRLEDWEELVSLYQRRAQLSEGSPQSLALLYKVATIFEEILQDPDRAVDAYQVILEEAPEEAEAARGLEKLYRQEARWRDLAELYRREAARAQDPAASIGRKHLLAGVLCVELGDLPEAVEIYREILTQDPSYRPSRDALEELLRRVDDPDLRVQVAVMLQPLYDEATEWERLIFALEVQLDVVQDPAARVSLFAEVARLRERWQADPLAAFEAYARAFHEDVRDEALRAQLERLAGAQGLWGRLVEIYLEAVDQHPELARAVALLHRAAQLYLDPMRDRDSAITAYCQVLELDSQDLPAILKLEELYRAAGLWRELVETLYKKADLSDDVLARKETLYRVAELWERALGDDQMAIDTWRQILDLDEEDLVAMEALERLYRRNADWENLITIFQVKVDLVDTQEEKIKVWQDVAEVYEVELQDTEEAINAYQTIRSLDADHASAIGALDRLYTREARWDDLLDILEIERQMAGEDVDARNAVEFRMGRLLEEHLMDPVRAIDFYRRIVERSPEHAPALEALELLISEPDTRMQAARVLEPLYERKGEWRKLVDALELKLEEILEPDLRRQALERMAVIHEERLRSQPLAFITYGRAFREAPEQPAAQEALERLAKVMGNWDELIAIYEEKLDDIYDFSLVKRLNLRLGQLHEEKLGDNGAAITRYQRVLDVEEYDPDALDALDRLFRAEQRWDLLGDVLERKIRQSDDPAARAELKFRLGYLQEVSFGQPDEAISHYKEILAAQPQHPGALEALERLVAAEDHRLEISDVLEPLYEAREDWAKLVGILEGRLALSEDPLESSALHQRVAALQEARLGDAPAAFQSWSQALRRTPEDPALGAQVSRLAARCGRWAEAAALYEEIADALYGPDRVEALLQAAGWRRAQLNQPREAEEVLRRVLAEDGENAAAMTALEELYTEAGDAEALYGLFDHKVHTLYDPAQRKALLQEMARLASQDLRDDERAIDAWRRLRESDDADLDALAALQALYARAARWEELLEVLDRRAELADDNAQRVALRLQMGEVARDQLGDPARAIDAFRYALDLSPGHAAALEALEALYEGAQEWMSLQEILVKRLQFADGDAAVIAHNRKLARLSEERFEDLDGALEGYRQILAIAPQHPEALAELERLYRKGERWYDLLEIYQQRLDATQEQGARLQLHVAISELAANQLHDMATAKSHLQEVLAADPNNVGALGVLGSLYLADGEWDKALEINARQIEHTADAAALSRLYLTRGQMVVDHFDDLAEATRCLREAVALDPHHREAADALKAHYERTGAWAALLELQRAEVARLDPAARVQPYLEMARVAREKLQDPDQAVLALEAAWEASGGQQEVAEELLQAYLDAGQTQKAEPILENLIETLTQKRRHKELFKFHHMRGQIALQRGDQAQAMTSFQAAYDLDATYIPNLLSLGRLYVAHERWDDALKVFQTLLLHQMKIKENEDKRDVYYFLGLVRRALGDDRRARDMFNRALGVDKDHAPSREALESL
jgi:tetratricopeptide (TPR) repeat protein